ncbi:glycine cleavage system protein L [Blattamonas nauphoetae]|uniref:Glycine cleavage system protein L n=1 Tax=Blattamonas nauphoetae TaxID=2049346 RepID=A0ABQ9YE84_9EUKA|nr:glycine cleavage system protein L [Blattamonas nauphoetae]
MLEETFEFDVIVVGTGPGGIGIALKAADCGLKVLTIEKNELGGTCVNAGCVPSKGLCYMSHLADQLSDCEELETYGISAPKPTLNYPQMLKKIENAQDYHRNLVLKLFQERKITHVFGTAEILKPHHVKVIHRETKETRQYSARFICLACGSKPSLLPLAPVDPDFVYTSDTLDSVKSVPESITIVGAGAIGLEYGSVFSRLGSKVVFIDAFGSIGGNLDAEISHYQQIYMESKGITFHLNSKIENIEINRENRTVMTTFSSESNGRENVQTSIIFLCVGRTVHSDWLPSEIQRTNKGMIYVDSNFETTMKGVFAIGDAIDGPKIAHKAEWEAICLVNYLANNTPVPSRDSVCLPCVIYTQPELAAVGPSEQALKAAGTPYTTHLLAFNSIGRDTTQTKSEGRCKIITSPLFHQGVVEDVIVAVHYWSASAGDLVAEAILAVENRIPLEFFGNVPHAHPLFKSLRFMHKVDLYSTSLQ